MLHIHNGDSSAGTLREFGFPGEHLAFREALVAGPTPADLSTEEWLRVRSKFLGDDDEETSQHTLRGLREQEAKLQRFTDHEEVVLWFEHDLFCQANLIYLLNWFATRELGNTRLSLICIDRFEGIEDFRGLGQLTGEQMASLFDARHTVTEAEFIQATTAWTAYTSPTPERLHQLTNSAVEALPFLAPALRLHLERFPSVENGLGRIERHGLELIASGRTEFKELFPAFWKVNPGYGLGDTQFWDELKRLADVPRPLLTINGVEGPHQSQNSNHFLRSKFELTELGSAVLAGRADFISENGIDQWLGGVHLKTGNIWRWNQATQGIQPEKTP